MKTLIVKIVGLVLAVYASTWCFDARADSRGDDLAGWLDQRGQEVWGEPPRKCDDLTLARRLYLDLIGRVPSVSELRDFEEMGPDRRKLLVEQLVFSEGRAW